MRAARPFLLTAFLFSGAAGLVYELAWSRYLALFVGHSVYAQILVITVFLGGMAIGALVVGERCQRLRAPFLWYIGVELALALFGVLFHPVFRGVTDFAYGRLFPSLGWPTSIAAVEWVLAGLMILPQSILLGATFPLMTGGALRADPERRGGTVAIFYFANSLGGAAGILTAGFVLVAAFGLPGTLLSAALLNILAAASAAAGLGTLRKGGTEAPQTAVDRTPDTAAASFGPRDGPVSHGWLERLWWQLLTVSALTAVASFIYEIGWIRMLSLVMGSATHSFELMLSAFIFGLAIGALWIRRSADSSRDPIARLAVIQWLMGAFALATLPVYAASFGWMASLLDRLPATEAGYRLFGLGRYGLAMAVMLPSTIMAGMTLPLITATLLRARAGERAVGWVYGINTLGSIVGVSLAGLALLPWLGLKGMLIAGASLDMALGAWLLAIAGGSRDRARAGRGVPRWATAAAVFATGVAAAGAGLLVPLDRAVLTAGVFRYGELPEEGSQPILFYADGRTATVGVHLRPADSLVVLTSNGKPDASLTVRWLRAASEPVPIEPISQQDEATQVLCALVTLAHRPDAREAAVVGHGSGISAHYLLGSPALQSLTTIEIEPRMIDGSSVYFPANRRVFDDPRSRMVIADARSFLSHAGRRFDLVVSEPSNPWVSGTASLFTVEFYQRVRSHLTEGGVFGQWFHLYESSDELVLTVLAALRAVFPAFRGYLVGDSDILVVATAAPELPEPDWSVLALPDIRSDLSHVPRFEADHLAGLHLFDSEELEPLLRGWETPNSDFHPHLESGAEQARFVDSFADGLYGLAIDRFKIAAALGSWRTGFSQSTTVPAVGLRPIGLRALGAWLRAAGKQDSLPGADPGGRRRAARRYASLFGYLEAAEPPTDWNSWMTDFVTTEAALHAGTAGVADTAFYRLVFSYLDEIDAPADVRSAASFLYGLAVFDFARAAPAVWDLLYDPDGEGIELANTPVVAALDPGMLLDGGVVASLAIGQPGRARTIFEGLLDSTGRQPGDLRSRLLLAHIEEAEAALSHAAQREDEEQKK